MVLQKPWVSLKFSIFSALCASRVPIIFFAKLSHTLDIFAICLEVPICL